jgi:hypothetical protein
VGGGIALVRLCTGVSVKKASRASEANSFMSMAPDLFCELVKISVDIRHMSVYIRHMEATHMTIAQQYSATLSKLSALGLLRAFTSLVTRFNNADEASDAIEIRGMILAIQIETRRRARKNTTLDAALVSARNAAFHLLPPF